MYERNQPIAFETIFQISDFQNEKKIDKFGLNYLKYVIQPLVLHSLRCSF